ncbi:hypothetical protein PYCCODRAFT_416651 [Trametes coccinea BRFM310]|uniref:F-box domain-containing protein n=1 Tax=Trametes coccinea (strain BRFM310) TaxID=1353009 RepID=A0A1Y2INP8_TRAC3|nr:hypothetical protein PYCCODRAFT_416651 [Trametes coccinea BRFM310]
MVQTRRSARRDLQPAIEHQRQYFLRLPPELRRMILECFNSRGDRRWLAKIATVCKAFHDDVEAVLYRDVSFISRKKILSFRHALCKRPRRATFVREFSILLVKATKSIRKPLKSVFRLLTNLISLEIFVPHPALFELLLDVPFQLRYFYVFALDYPPCLEDILARQPSLVFFEQGFNVTTGDRATPRNILRKDILPNLRSLAIELSHLSRPFIKHPLPSLTRLSLGRAQHEDIAQVLSLFGNNLVSLQVVRVIDNTCTCSCYWPTSIINTAHLPRLLHIEVKDSRSHEYRGLQLHSDMDKVGVSHLRTACPELRKFVWGTDTTTLRRLEKSLGRQRKDWTVMSEYSRILFSVFPNLARLCVTDIYSMGRGPRREPHNNVYMRHGAKNGQVARVDEHRIVDVANEWCTVPDGLGTYDECSNSMPDSE